MAQYISALPNCYSQKNEPINKISWNQICMLIRELPQRILIRGDPLGATSIFLLHVPFKTCSQWKQDMKSKGSKERNREWKDRGRERTLQYWACVFEVFRERRLHWDYGTGFCWFLHSDRVYFSASAAKTQHEWLPTFILKKNVENCPKCFTFLSELTICDNFKFYTQERREMSRRQGVCVCEREIIRSVWKSLKPGNPYSLLMRKEHLSVSKELDPGCN